MTLTKKSTKSSCVLLSESASNMIKVCCP